METLKEKCERIRSEYDIYIPKKRYVMGMIDGKNFSRLIKNKYKKPFDDIFINMMNEVAIELCKNVQGMKFAYTQSDEITFVMTDFESEECCAYFDNRLCKLQSLIPSIATAKFNHLVTLNLLDTPCSHEDMKEMVKNMKLAQFDCKIWSTEDFNDVFAYILWRQNDCIRNSKQQTAQTYLPHKALNGKTCDEQVEMLIREKGVDWHSLDNGKKYGRFIYKEAVEKALSDGGLCLRNIWIAHNAFPLNSAEGKKEFLKLNIIPIKEN